MILLISLQDQWHEFDWGNGWFIFPMIMMSLFFILIIILMFSRRRFHWPWYQFDDFHPRSRSRESAMEILKKRYAKGEINKEEFENIKKDLLV